MFVFSVLEEYEEDRLERWKGGGEWGEMRFKSRGRFRWFLVGIVVFILSKMGFFCRF